MIRREEIEDYIHNLKTIAEEIQEKTDLGYTDCYKIAVSIMTVQANETLELIGDTLDRIADSIELIQNSVKVIRENGIMINE